MIPEHVIDTKSELVHRFYTGDNTFQLGAQYLPKLRTVAKMTKDGENIEFAASFILVELDNYLVAFLDVIRTGDKCQRKGLGSIFIDTLVGFMEQRLAKSEDSKYKGGFFMVGQSRKLKPH